MLAIGHWRTLWNYCLFLYCDPDFSSLADIPAVPQELLSTPLKLLLDLLYQNHTDPSLLDFDIFLHVSDDLPYHVVLHVHEDQDHNRWI